MSATERIYKVRFHIMGSEGLVEITMDKWFTFDDAVDTIKEGISWMKSAFIVKVKEEVVTCYSEKDFKVVI